MPKAIRYFCTNQYPAPMKPARLLLFAFCAGFIFSCTKESTELNPAARNGSSETSSSRSLWTHPLSPVHPYVITTPPPVDLRDSIIGLYNYTHTYYSQCDSSLNRTDVYQDSITKFGTNFVVLHYTPTDTLHLRVNPVTGQVSLTYPHAGPYSLAGSPTVTSDSLQLAATGSCGHDYQNNVILYWIEQMKAVKQ